VTEWGVSKWMVLVKTERDKMIGKYLSGPFSSMEAAEQFAIALASRNDVLSVEIKNEPAVFVQKGSDEVGGSQ
jgi:hypothetical protein